MFSMGVGGIFRRSGETALGGCGDGDASREMVGKMTPAKAGGAVYLLRT